MKFTDKEYLLLNMLCEHHIPSEVKEGTIQEIANRLLTLYEYNSLNEGSAENSNQETHSFLEEIREHENIVSLELVAWKQWNNIVAYAFRNKQEENVISFVYKGENPIEGYADIIGKDIYIFQEALQFFEENKGKNAVVTGLTLGGVFAMFVSAKVGNVTGVVFDSPGIGTVLNSNPTIQVKNYVSMNSFIAALGEHTEEIVFASPNQEMGDSPFSDNWQDKFSFDDNQSLLTGEDGGMFYLLSKISQSITLNSPVFNQVIQAFSQAVHVENDVDEDVSHILFSIAENFDANKLRTTFQIIEGQYEKTINENYAKTKSELLSLANINEIDDIDNKVGLFTEKIMQQVENSYEEYYQSIEALLSFLVLYAEDENFETHIEEELNNFIEKLNGKLDQISIKITNDLETFIQSFVSSFEESF